MSATRLERPKRQSKTTTHSGKLSPTPEMMERAARIGSVAAKVAGAWRKAIDKLNADCKEGDIESCYVAFERRNRTPPPMHVHDDQVAARNKAREQAHQVIEHCKSGHPGFCASLGVWVEFYHELEEHPVRALDPEEGLENTLSNVLRHLGKSKKEASVVAKRLVSMIRVGGPPPQNLFERWMASCLKDDPTACLKAGICRKMDMEGKIYGHLPPSRSRVMSALCEEFDVVCNYSAFLEMQRGKRTKGEYQQLMRERCHRGNADACRRHAVAVESSQGPAAGLEAYEHACQMGDVEACSRTVDPLLAQGTTSAALSNAIAACHKDFTKNCRPLMERFAESRDFTTQETGKQLASFACEQGHLPGCRVAATYAYQSGDVVAARRAFGKACFEKGDLLSCRHAAQLAFRMERYDSAEELLRRGYHRDDINSVIELAAVLAYRGKTREALELLEIECRRSEGPHPCKLEQRIRRGVAPDHVNEIFQHPLDGSEYVYPQAPSSP